MYKDKRDVVKEYQEYCRRCCSVESMSTASYWCEIYLRRDTKINQQRIAQIYEYMENKEKYIETNSYEPLILEPEDWTENEWNTILKLFNMKSASRIKINYRFEAWGIKNN